MALTESSKSSKAQVFCRIRKSWVKKTPEEQVRQALLHAMIEKLGFLSALIAVEKSLDQLPHLQETEGLPKRRADILCFSRDFLPLLLIECKQDPIDAAAIEQVIGYNAFVRAPFLALADLTGVFFLHGRQLMPGLPTYDELTESRS
jgi:hypothetical protein